MGETVLSNELYGATRALLWATSASELTGIVVDFVAAVGVSLEHSLPTLVADAWAALARRQGRLPTANKGRLPEPNEYRHLGFGVSLEHMFSGQCLDCRADVSFSERPGETVCPGCGLRLYMTADGQLGRYLPEDWRPGGIQGFR